MQNGMSQNALLRRDIIFSINDLHRGWTEINLHSHNIMLAGSQQVLAAIEWLANEPEVTKGGFLDIPAHVSATHSIFVRDKSTQNWRKLGANPNMYFTGISYPE